MQRTFIPFRFTKLSVRIRILVRFKILIRLFQNIRGSTPTCQRTIVQLLPAIGLNLPMVRIP